MAKHRLAWQTFAGGTSAHHGYSYAAYDTVGEYHVWPPQRRGGSYALKWANTSRIPVDGLIVTHTGLWHDLGSYRSPGAAKGAAQRHAGMLHAAYRINPRRRRRR